MSMREQKDRSKMQVPVPVKDTPSQSSLIEGVIIKKLRVIPDERGRLMEILRRDDECYEEFGQVYMTTGFPGVVKGWHYHVKQVDHFSVVKGMIKLVLFDSREDSPTKGQINEFFLGVHNPILVKIPRLVYHGFKTTSEEEAIVINIPTEPYNYTDPDEYRLPSHTDEIPYDWARKDK